MRPTSRARVNGLQEELREAVRERNSREDYLDNLQISRAREPKLDEVRREIRELDQKIADIQRQLQDLEEQNNWPSKLLGSHQGRTK